VSDALLPTYARADFGFERGEGPYLYSTDGRRFLDFAAGIAVNSLGHCHPHLVKTLGEQGARLWHVSNLYQIPEQARLADRLIANTFADRAFFCNSGAEAMECGLKMLRVYHDATGNPERYRVITFEGAFHGRTLATIAAGGQEKHLAGFEPVMDGFDQVPFGDLEAVRGAIGPETAAVLVEPVQGEGGIVPAAHEFLQGLRQLADEHGLLLFLDEIQCGVARTGKLFAHEWAGITPDIMAMAKGIGSGFPVGACLATEAAAVGMTAGTHGSTFGGNPLAMAIGNAVLDVVLEDGFLEHVLQVSNHFKQQLGRIVDEHGDIVEEARGAGLMLALKCRVPNTDMLAAVRKQGLLGVAGGDNVLRMLPPLIIDNTHVGEAVEMIAAACAELEG
jgi:acetylornithine/N-succinyldiaminopimelate aminotransferase